MEKLLPQQFVAEHVFSSKAHQHGVTTSVYAFRTLQSVFHVEMVISCCHTYNRRRVNGFHTPTTLVVGCPTHESSPLSPPIFRTKPNLRIDGDPRMLCPATKASPMILRCSLKCFAHSGERLYDDLVDRRRRFPSRRVYVSGRRLWFGFITHQSEHNHLSQHSNTDIKAACALVARFQAK